MTCRNQVENEAVKDLFEYDETVAFDPKAQYVGRIGRIVLGGSRSQSLAR